MVLHGYRFGRRVPRYARAAGALSFRLPVAAFVAAGLVSAAGSGRAATLDFGALNHNTNSYISDGFALSTNLEFLSSSWGNPAPGMFVGATNQTNTLRIETGGAFDVLSVDLTEQNELVGPQTITFTGWLADGATVTQVFTTDGPFGYQTFTFSEQFRALARLEWDQLDPESFFIYDNFVVAATPVAVRPTSWSGIRALYRD